jgi:hypothetical protein
MRCTRRDAPDNDRLEDYACDGRLPEPLPEPLPKGSSRLDGLDRKRLIKLWEEQERIFGHRSQDELEFYTKNGYWPEQGMHPRYYLQDGLPSIGWEFARSGTENPLTHGPGTENP